MTPEYDNNIMDTPIDEPYANTVIVIKKGPIIKSPSYSEVEEEYFKTPTHPKSFRKITNISGGNPQMQKFHNKNSQVVKTQSQDHSSSDPLNILVNQLMLRNKNNEVYYDDGDYNMDENSDESLLLMANTNPIPKSCDEITNDSNWLIAIDKESFTDRTAASEVNESDADNIISFIWGFTIKNNNKPLYKTRLAVRGFEEQLGIHYNTSFTPVTNYLKILISIFIGKSVTV